MVNCSLPERESPTLEHILWSLICIRRTPAVGKILVCVLCPIIAWISIEFSLDWCSQPFLVRLLLDCIEEKSLCDPLLFCN